jgi:hypothetical protein
VLERGAYNLVEKPFLTGALQTILENAHTYSLIGDPLPFWSTHTRSEWILPDSNCRQTALVRSSTLALSIGPENAVR